MSTEVRGAGRSAARRRRGRRVFAASFAIVLAVLAVAALGGSVATNAQGPRVSDIRVDPAAAAASGSRLIVTTTASLAEVDPSQVSVSPATPFTVDTSGRTVGVRFSLPLWDETEYTVRIDGLQAVGGGPASSATETFQTPALQIYTLQRGGTGGDEIVRSRIDGSEATPVFTNAHIEDFRATASYLVVSVLDDAGNGRLTVTDPDGGGARELPLPGEGTISALQSADKGDVVGYTFSDADLGAAGGLESRLFTSSLKDAASADPPTAIEVPGSDPRVASWRFVPDTDALLALSFDGRLNLVSSTGGDPVALGNAVVIDGIARGSSRAVVERADAVKVIDLRDGSESTLVAATDDLGRLGTVTPLPGEDAGDLRIYTQLADAITPLGNTLDRVAADGTSTRLLSVDADDAVLQTCVSPSGRYAAVTVAPDVAANPYDAYLLPLPQNVQTRIISVADGSEIAALTGSAVSWCQSPVGS